MKSLKFTKEQIDPILSGQYYKTWRLLDDKKLHIDDKLQLINSENGNIFASAEVVAITTKHLRDINEYDKTGHFEYPDDQSMYDTFHRFYGPSINQDNVVKVIEFRLLDKILDEKVENNTTQITEVKLYTDGGSRGNPGPSASGYAIFDMNDRLVKESGEYLGITTNNQAEYQAVRLGLEECKKLNASIVHVYMDSLLVVNQMTGIFKIKNRDLWPIHQSIKNLSVNFKQIKYTHIPRELNKTADAMVNKVLDAHKNTGDQSQLL